VHRPFLCASLKGGGRQLDGVGVSSVGVGQVPGARGPGLTLDVTGHVWRLGDWPSLERFVGLGRGGGSRVEMRCHGAPPRGSRFPPRWLRPPGVLSFGRFFFFFLFFLYHVLIVKVQELACSARYGVKKTLISTNQKTNENYQTISKLCQILDTSPTHG